MMIDQRRSSSAITLARQVASATGLVFNRPGADTAAMVRRSLVPIEAAPAWKDAVLATVAAALVLLAVSEAAVPLAAVGVVLVLWTGIGLWTGASGSIGLLALAAPALVGADGPVLATGAAAAACVWFLCRLERQRHLDERDLTPMRMQVRTGLYQQRVLQRQIARYPRLLDVCSRLFAAQEKGQLATLICDEVESLVPDTRLVAVTIAIDDGEPYRHVRGHDDNAYQDHEAFVLEEQRPVVLRLDDRVAVFQPLRGDRRQPGGIEGRRRAVLTVVFGPQGLEDYLLIDILEALGRLAGLSLASVLLLEQARSLALFDDLTGLYGQHEFIRRLDEHIADCRRNDRQCGVIMCDMDHLKDFNDRYGHPAGDDALRTIARLIRSLLGEDAIACRYGGEEFALLIPEPERVADTAEQLCVGIRSAVLDGGARVTASLGWALLDDADDDGRALLHRADVACYQGKRAGRDQVVGPG